MAREQTLDEQTTVKHMTTRWLRARAHAQRSLPLDWHVLIIIRIIFSRWVQCMYNVHLLYRYEAQCSYWGRCFVEIGILQSQSDR